MEENDPKKHPELFETLTLLCEHQGLTHADVARAIGMPPGTFKRSFTGNPTVMFVKRVAWALGIDWLYLALPPEDITSWFENNLIQVDYEAPAFKSQQMVEEGRNNKRRVSKRKYGADVGDKEVLAQIYPPEATQGDILDTNYVEFDHPLVPKTINPGEWEKERARMGEGLPEHLVMTDKAVEARFTYQQYLDAHWTLALLAQEGLICEKGQEG